MKLLKKFTHFLSLGAARNLADISGQRAGEARLEVLYQERPHADWDTVLAEYTRAYCNGYYHAISSYKEEEAEKGFAADGIEPPNDRELASTAAKRLRRILRRNRSNDGAFGFMAIGDDGGGGDSGDGGAA